jgi:large subunit ribosomal protein L18
MIKNRSREKWLARKARVRRTVHGDTARPRLSVFRSAKHIYAQVIDDEAGKTLVTASTLDKEIKGSDKMKKAQLAEKVGQLLAERCLAKNIKAVVFDRNGFIYHGRVAKLADGARAKGLDF